MIIVVTDSKHTDDALSALMNEELMTDVDISSGKHFDLLIVSFVKLDVVVDVL